MLVQLSIDSDYDVVTHVVVTGHRAAAGESWSSRLTM